MTKSVVVWIYVIYYCYLLQPVCTGTTYTSKACYGSGTPCARHDLRCNSSQKIAIYDAYFTDNTECSQHGVSNCYSLNPDNITEHGYHKFNNTELAFLYKNCSTKSQCAFRGPRRGTSPTFSVVKYQCIKEGDTLNITRDVTVKYQASPKHGDKMMSHCSIQNHSYECIFKSLGTASGISVYALEVTLNGRQCFSKLSVQTENVITTSNCSAGFQPFERLNITSKLPLHMHFKDIPNHCSIWLLITGTHTGTTATHDSTTNESLSSGQAKSNAGAIAGGIVATVVAVLVVTLVSVWIIRHKRADREGNEKTTSLPKDAKPDMTYSLPATMPQNNYHEVQDLRKHNNDYDYATAGGMALPPTTNTYLTIEPAGKLTARDDSTACTTEGEYDHIGDKPSPQTGDYDTTASVAQPGHFGEDSYGYNHFQKEVNSQTHQNDYDTAASATKSVAKISTTERNTDENDYDHFHRGTNGSESVSSPYDTTSGGKDNSDYSVAEQMK